jgi:lysophospholipase L1-like esterase
VSGRGPRRRRRARGIRYAAAAALLASVLGACTGVEQPEEAVSEAPRPPRTMAALGDSITRAFASCGRVGDCVEASWATGTAAGLDSHWERLGNRDGERAHNVAVSGARVTHLAAQVEDAVRVRPDYVTILIGANDACAPDEAAMTSVAEFTGAFGGALDALVRQLPRTRVLVLSIPDLSRLWEVGRDEPEVLRVWESYGICQSMLAGATDTGPAAAARRDRVRGRIQAFNTAMAAACARHADRCRHDGNAVFDHRFGLDDVSTVDYWHPSQRGQATLAEVSWGAGFWA